MSEKQIVTKKKKSPCTEFKIRLFFRQVSIMYVDSLTAIVKSKKKNGQKMVHFFSFFFFTLHNPTRVGWLENGAIFCIVVARKRRAAMAGESKR